VAFYSAASNLVSGDTNVSYDVFVKDLSTNSITRVSTAADSTQGNSSSGIYGLAISADGRYVVFESFASNLVGGDTNGTQDVFIKDLSTNNITRVSTAVDGTQGNNISSRPTMSNDGRYVVFYSVANNLVSGDTNNLSDVFVKDLSTNSITRVSTAADGTQANNQSAFAAISANGRYVVFTSPASNLVSGDINVENNVFIKDLSTNSINRLSDASDGTQGNGNSGSYSTRPAISADGRFVVFESTSSNLVSGDTNGTLDLFLSTQPVNSLPTLAINDVTIAEGNSGTSNAVFTVTRTGNATQAITVNYATANSSATAGSDYTGTSGTLTFATNETTKTVIVPIIGDTTIEENETFFVNLSNAVNATITDSQGLGTITNDDNSIELPSITFPISPSIVNEDASSNLVYTFTRNADITKPLVINFNVSGTATFNTDYTQTGATNFNVASGSITFAANVSTITLVITPQSDTTLESNETVSLSIKSDSSYTIGTTNTLTGIIINVVPPQIINGTPGNDQINAGSGNDVINGGLGNDQINAGSGDDIINGGLGDDQIIGGAGNDTAIFSGNRSDYSINIMNGTVNGLDGNDLIAGIEFLKFNDQTVNVLDIPII